jgi:hypothetical protein
MERIATLAAGLDLPVRELSKHDLNMLSDNRPHQVCHFVCFFRV